MIKMFQYILKKSQPHFNFQSLVSRQELVYFRKFLSRTKHVLELSAEFIDKRRDFTNNFGLYIFNNTFIFGSQYFIQITFSLNCIWKGIGQRIQSSYKKKELGCAKQVESISEEILPFVLSHFFISYLFFLVYDKNFSFF